MLVDVARGPVLSDRISRNGGTSARLVGLSKPTTIYDIAREAGCATSTVSRALSDPQRVSTRMREHVLAVADRLGYTPNPMARALPSGRTQTIALLVPDITNPYFFGIIRGAEGRAAAGGFTLILGDTRESPEMELRCIERLERGVDGFVLASSRLSDELIRELSGRCVLTLVNREVGDVPHAIVDTVDGTRQIAEHLASLGHRAVAFLAGPRTSWAGARRWRALSTSARQLGMTAVRLGPFAPAIAGGAAAADAALGAGVTAVVAHNDLVAIGALHRFAERGVRVPADMSVVGYDDIFGADFCSPPLTTLAGPLEDVGRSAVDLLLDVLAHRGSGVVRRRVHLPSHLVVRHSTGPAPASPKT